MHKTWLNLRYIHNVHNECIVGCRALIIHLCSQEVLRQQLVVIEVYEYRAERFGGLSDKEKASLYPFLLLSSDLIVFHPCKVYGIQTEY